VIKHQRIGLTSAGGAKITLMAISSIISRLDVTFDELFFQPLHQCIESLSWRRNCPKFDDVSWLNMGVRRVIDEAGSGRGFLQENCLEFPSLPSVRNYFYSFCSERRAKMVTELNQMVLQSGDQSFGDRLADIPELASYEIFAIDGHWHSGATHDPKSSEKKVAT
jgi:hypothetical protein